MPTQRKVETVADLTDKLSRMQFMVVGDYRGLTVAEITDLRRRLRESGAELIVAKNTLAQLAARASGREGLDSILAGPTAIAFAYDDVAKAAKAINDFNRGPKKLVIRGGMLGADVLAANAADVVASLPSRQQLLGEILGGVSSPLSGVVGVINAAVSNIVYLLQARIDQQQPAEEAAA